MTAWCAPEPARELGGSPTTHTWEVFRTWNDATGRRHDLGFAIARVRRGYLIRGSADALAANRRSLTVRGDAIVAAVDALHALLNGITDPDAQRADGWMALLEAVAEQQVAPAGQGAAA